MLKLFIKKIPLAIKFYEIAYNYTKIGQNNKVIEQLKKSNFDESLKLLDVLELTTSRLPPKEEDWKNKIEKERKRLLNCNDKLASSNLGESIYDADLTVKQACLASKPLKQALFLYFLAREFKPEKALELGTNLGISSAYIGAAMQTYQDEGTLLTLDASPNRQGLAEQLHQNLGISNIKYVQGYFNDTLKASLDRLQTVDLAFIDGHHQFKPTLDYFEQIYKHAKPKTIFIFDDIRWTHGMRDAWQKIQEDERLGLVVDLFSVGIAIPLEEKTQRLVTSPYYLV